MAQKPSLPSWMKNDPNQQLQDNASWLNATYGRSDRDLGYADMDQFASSMPNLGYNPGYVTNPPAGSPGFHSPQSGYQATPGMQGINQQGQAGTYEQGSRVKAALKGALTGPDTGSKAGNVALGVGARMMGPAGMAGRSVAGAVQGARNPGTAFRPSSADAARPTSLGNLPVGASAAPGAETARLGSGSDASMLDYEGPFGGKTPQPGSAAATATPESLLSQPPRSRVTGAEEEAPPEGGVAPETAAEEEPFQFTGGSGSPVEPYSLPEEEALAAYLAGGQKYGGYDPATGRTGIAASGINGYAAQGFDFGQDPGNRDIGKSMKYAFAYFANQAAANGKPMPKNRAEAEAWFNENILPGFQQLGYDVEWVQGDKFKAQAREGVFEVDFLSDAGGANPQLWFGADTPEQAALNAAMQSGGGGGGASGDPFESRTAKLGVADTGNPALDSYAQQIVNILLEREALDGAMAEGGGNYQRRYDRLRSFV